MAANMSCTTPPDYEAQATRLLEEKYGEPFEIVEVFTPSPTSGNYKVGAHPRSAPELIFNATVAMDGSSLTDGYVCRCVSAKIENQMRENLDGLEGDFLVKAGAAVKTIDSTDTGMSIAEYQAGRPALGYAIYLVYFPGATGASEIYNTISHSFDGLNELHGNLYLYITDDSTLEAVQKLFAQTANADSRFDDLVADSGCVQIAFENGTLAIDQQTFLQTVEEYL